MRRLDNTADMVVGVEIIASVDGKKFKGKVKVVCHTKGNNVYVPTLFRHLKFGNRPLNAIVEKVCDRNMIKLEVALLLKNYIFTKIGWTNSPIASLKLSAWKIV
jgi:hypothetical protein